MRSMRAMMLTLLFVVASTQLTSAIKVTLFTDLDTYVRRANQIVIAKCLSAESWETWKSWTSKSVRVDGLLSAEVQVQVLRTLKGSIEPGSLAIQTLYPMAAGKIYFLSTLGGDKFYATAQLSVV